MSNENSKELQEKILMSPKKKIHFVSKEELERADEFCEPYKDFLNKSRTEREAVSEAVAMAKDGKKTVAWDFVYIPSEEWKKNLKQALIAYAADNTKWDGVKNAFVDGWKTEKAASE